MTSSVELRQEFLSFFEKNNHKIIGSGSLVPSDPTLLLTNAGMVQFKEIFTGKVNPPSPRVTTVQRCVRAGGKHNDLENVGVTTRHHTLFEMMGNFSFGDYFKEQAIRYAWEFITKDCAIDHKKLYITYHHSDLETKEIWLKNHGIPANRIIACGDKDNFWSMGSTGPCGPCTEIFYDHGPNIAGGPPGSPDEDGDRFVEIWNLVFMQYNQDLQGNRVLLPKPCVDTGSGLERLSAVLQGVHDNYKTDQFLRLAEITNDLAETKLSDLTLRVVSDHIRSIACLINDGVLPSNEGRGYVLRRIIRRALCFLYRDNNKQPLLSNLLMHACNDPLLAIMQQKDLNNTINIVKAEENQFSEVYSYGSKAIVDIVASGCSKISGEQAFKLYDTHGLPIDLTKDIATASKINVDLDGFNRCMLEQKNRSKVASSFDKHDMSQVEISQKSDFVGYEQESSSATIVGIYDKDWQSLSSIADADCHIVLDKSVFYAESGGQVSDQGIIKANGSTFKVKSVKKYGSAIAIKGSASGMFHVNQEVSAEIDQDKRSKIRKNHTATHLLHAALRKVLGEHVEQKGSLVESEQLRFDFSHTKPITKEQMLEVESWVLEQIRLNLKVLTEITSFDEAKNRGAMALFEGKYQENVRLLSIGDVSLELCGGTHVKELSEIGNFAVTSETGVASGVRRITAFTSINADKHYQKASISLNNIAETLGGNANQINEKLAALLNKYKNCENNLENMTNAYINQRANDLAKDEIAISIENINDLDALNKLADKTCKKTKLAIIVSKFHNDRHNIIVASNSENHHAGEILKKLASKFSGKGGGKQSFARGQFTKHISQKELSSAVFEIEAKNGS